METIHKTVRALGVICRAACEASESDRNDFYLAVELIAGPAEKEWREKKGDYAVLEKLGDLRSNFASWIGLNTQNKGVDYANAVLGNITGLEIASGLSMLPPE